jgi:3',5'-cyclic AMP phosphodiesterase CpdA
MPSREPVARDGEDDPEEGVSSCRTAIRGDRALIERLRWLHISDLHLVASGDEFSQKVATQELIADARARLSEEPVSFVLVTGDIAFSGQTAEYANATSFFQELAAAIGIAPAGFYFVPGNHDVDRGKQRLAYRGACAELTSQAEVDRLLGSPGDLAPLIDRQAAFHAFVDDFTNGQERQPTADGLGFMAPLVIDELRVAVLGLNSAWLSGSDAEEMRLLIGERQVINALDMANELQPRLVIAMAHHPVEWLKEWDQLSCRSRLLREAHLYHRGHLHMDEVSWTASPERPCLSVAAGSGHATRFYSNSYNVIDLDLAAGRCTVHAFRFDVAAARYEPGPHVSASVTLRGSFPEPRSDLVEAIGGIPGAVQYADYLADLLVGIRVEIPIRVGGEVVFRSPSLAEAAGADGAGAAARFLGLRNIIPLYDDAVPLAKRLQHHAEAIGDFVTYLRALAEADRQCAERITARGLAGKANIDGHGAESHTAAFLGELRSRGDWIVLEGQARHLVNSHDPNVAHLAKRALIEALMHSDEGEKRSEARGLASALAVDASASVEDVLLAAASAEVVGDDASAVDHANVALERWPEHPDAQAYARALALRTGEAGLRSAADTIGTESQS